MIKDMLQIVQFVFLHWKASHLEYDWIAKNKSGQISLMYRNMGFFGSIFSKRNKQEDKIFEDIGDLALLDGKIQTAWKFYFRQLEENPNNLELWCKLIFQAHLYGDDEICDTIVKEALKINPDWKGNIASYLKISGITFKEKNECKLVKKEKSPDFEDERFTRLINRGTDLFNLHHYDEALKEYDRALEIYPEHKIAKNYRENALKELCCDKNTEPAKTPQIFQNDSHFCENCGIHLTGDEVYCMNCGKKI